MNGEREYKDQILDFKDGRIMVDYFSVPLIGNDSIKSITTKDGKIVYNNEYISEPLAIQKGLILGVKAGEEELESVEKGIKWSKDYAEKEYTRTCEALDKIPQVIEEGRKYIYPQRLEKWIECVCYRMAGIYNGVELINALQIMEALDEGKSVKEAEKLIDDGHSGNSFGWLFNIVVNFSKRGVEFCKNSNYYKITIKEDQDRWSERCDQLDLENAQFQDELDENNKE